MGWLTVIEPGMQTTVQDLGREGHTALGIPAGGAFDALSLRAGNRLVSNPDGAAALECTLIGPTLRFEHDATIALTGAHPINPAVQTWTRLTLRAGHTLAISTLTGGARAYLCISGGIQVPLTLGSASTLLNAGFGGYQGRVLKKGDRLEFNDHTPTTPTHLSPPRIVTQLSAQLAARDDFTTLRATDGPHPHAFNHAATDAFWNATFRVSNQSNRTGVRLEGPTFSTRIQGDMTSEGAPIGAVQITTGERGGQPIALGVDGPTTGGYPIIATIATVDLHLLGQIRPGEKLRFERVTLQQAREALIDRESEWEEKAKR